MTNEVAFAMGILSTLVFGLFVNCWIAVLKADRIGWSNRKKPK